MSVRADAVGYLAAILDEPLATAGMLADDSPGQLKEPLDATDRSMTFVPVIEGDANPDPVVYTALAELHTLLRIRRKIALRFDVTTAGDSFRLSQSVAQIDGLIAAARATALLLAGADAVAGGVVAPSDGGDLIAGITLDWSGGSRLDSEYARW